MLETLPKYTTIARKLIKEFVYKKGIIAYKHLHKSEELVGLCIPRIVYADEHYNAEKSGLSLYQYRRLHCFYAIRTFIQRAGKNKQRNPFYIDDINRDDLSFLSYKKTDSLEDREEKENFIKKIKKSRLGYKHEKYITELINGKTLIDIAHENRTTRPVVQRIINEGILKLNGE